MTAFDDLSLLRAFVCIVECGSISAGARRLKTPQPTLSCHMRLLEEHCGAALLRRDTHRMPSRSHERRMIMQETAHLYGISEQTPVSARGGEAVGLHQ